MQIVEDRQVNGRHKQHVIARLGRMDHLSESGRLDEITWHLAKLCNEVQIVNASREGNIQAKTVRCLGPALVSDRLWKALGIDRVLNRLLAQSRSGLDMERAVLLTVLHSLFVSGSDRTAEKRRADYRIDGVKDLSLHQLYRAMGWLGERLSEEEQADATPLAPRCTKNLGRGCVVCPTPGPVHKFGHCVFRYHVDLLRG